MKKTLLIFSVVALNAITAFAQVPQKTAAPTDSANMAAMTFEAMIIDYGTIENNSDGNREFKFKNTGKEPLIITEAHGSCQCTVPKWSKEPVKPGEIGVITVHYNTGNIGSFEKMVYVASNAKTPSVTLKIKGQVLPKK